MNTQHYLTWSVSQDRQRHEWLQVRRSIMHLRLSFLIGGHIAYFGLCGVAHALSCFNQYGHSFWVGCWSLALIGATLFLFEKVYTRTWHIERPCYAIRQNGLTAYGDDGPSAHYAWSRTPVLHIENDAQRPEFRSLILSEARKSRWLRRAGRVAIPLPSPLDESLNETHVVAALRHAIEDNGMSWVTAASGEIVLCR